MRLLTGLLLAANMVVILVTGCDGETPGTAPADAAPRCRVESVNLNSVTKTRDFNNCTAENFATLCDEGVTEQDGACADNCKLYNKRGIANPTDPSITGQECPADPVIATVPPFTDDACKEIEDSNQVRISCTVTASCTCDP